MEGYHPRHTRPRASAQSRLAEVGHHLRLYAVLDVGGIESLVGEHGVVTRIDAGLYGARRGIVAESS